uniref:alpha-soluble NSF attachment protein-like n=1 Tax=Ciona intestinalis TaxID=7719 RepID=UPI000180C24C|nr:alpha-soluble NSF attachment protein-like [Ciona intestinalis]|eukprot:XP_002119495.1 alpha-soluble NSF attachment protein-like [Ciona intestinalis]
MSKEKEACEILAEAEKLSKSGTGFFSQLFGGSMKLEDACDKYVKAGNLFKMGKKWSEAGAAFRKSADIREKLANKHESASNLVDAAGCYKKSEPEQAITCLARAIDIFTDMGRFTIAAKHHMSIAELYEADALNIEKAIAHYEKAADYYDGEDSKSSANKCWLKVAAYAAQLQQYTKAIELYERVALTSIESPLLKYAAKEYMFKATLCQFCLGCSGVDARQAIEKYEEWMPAFEDSRECKLVKKLIEAYENNSADGFAEAIAEYDKVTRIDEWLTTILLRIKKTIAGGDEDIDNM